MSDATESTRDYWVPEWSRPVLLGGLGSLLVSLLILAVAWGQLGERAEAEAEKLEEQAERLSQVAERATTRADVVSARQGALEVRQAEQAARFEALFDAMTNRMDEFKESLVRIEDRLGTTRRGD